MHRIAPFAADHHGLLNLVSAYRAGLDRADIAFAARQGEIVRLHRGVYRFAAAPPTWEGDLLAACWAAGSRGFASHRSAAALHALPGADPHVVEITCPRWRRAHHDTIVVHESSHWTSADVVRVANIPVASPALTLLQLAGCVSISTLELALERVLHRELASLDSIDDLLRRYARRGRRGVRMLRMLVRARTPETAPTDSSAETRVLQVIRRHALAEPVRQFTVRRANGTKVGTVDLAYPEARIAIEYDSDEFHTGRVATSQDSERRHRLIAAGWMPITAVSSDLRSGGGLLCAALRAALAERTCGAVLAPETAA